MVPAKNESFFSKKSRFMRFFSPLRVPKNLSGGFFSKKTVKMTFSGFYKSGFVLSYIVGISTYWESAQWRYPVRI